MYNVFLPLDTLELERPRKHFQSLHAPIKRCLTLSTPERPSKLVEAWKRRTANGHRLVCVTSGRARLPTDGVSRDVVNRPWIWCSSADILKRAENTLGIRKDCKIDLLRDAVSEGDLLVVEIPYSDITSIFKTNKHNAIRIMKIFWNIIFFIKALNIFNYIIFNQVNCGSSNLSRKAIVTIIIIFTVAIIL